MAGHFQSHQQPRALIREIECPEPVEGLYWVYVLQSEDRKLYVGQSKNLKERLRKHKYGLGSKFTKDHKVPNLVFFEKYTSLESAVARERQIKKWSRAKKIALIQNDIVKLKLLARSNH